jgi:hypothetical protein
VCLTLRPSLDVSDVVFNWVIDQSKKTDPMGLARSEGGAVEIVDGISITLD